MHPKFDPTGVQTHDLQIMTVQLMSLSSNHLAISDLHAADRVTKSLQRK